MAAEKHTESLTLREMKCVLGDNGWGYVFPDGDVSAVEKVEKLLKKAGGKPVQCALDDFTQGGNGKAKPEYIITMNDDANTLIVIECKNTVKKHASTNLDRPRGFAVDGVLYYAKFLKEEYNVVAVAISGTTLSSIKADAFHWLKGHDAYSYGNYMIFFLKKFCVIKNTINGKVTRSVQCCARVFFDCVFALNNNNCIRIIIHCYNIFRFCFASATF